MTTGVGRWLEGISFTGIGIGYNYDSGVMWAYLPCHPGYAISVIGENSIKCYRCFIEVASPLLANACSRETTTLYLDRDLLRIGRHGVNQFVEGWLGRSVRVEVT